MKKIFTVTSVLILAVALLVGCSKRGGYSYDEDYWLSRERGIVVYSDDYCPYYVVETRNGYTVIESVSGYAPFEGTVIYGDLSREGYMDLYNYSDGIIVRGDVVDYWLNYYDAQYMIDNFCYPAYKNNGSDSAARVKKTIKKADQITVRERKK
jgi:hypothetical protein